MKSLAITAVVLIMILVIGLQHLFNYWIRKGIEKNDDPICVLGAFGIIISALVAGITIYNAVLIFGGGQD